MIWFTPLSSSCWVVPSFALVHDTVIEPLSPAAAASAAGALSACSPEPVPLPVSLPCACDAASFCAGVDGDGAAESADSEPALTCSELPDPFGASVSTVVAADVPPAVLSSAYAGTDGPANINGTSRPMLAKAAVTATKR